MGSLIISSNAVSVNDTQNETTYPTTTSKGDTSFSSHQEDFLKENISEVSIKWASSGENLSSGFPSK